MKQGRKGGARDSIECGAARRQPPSNGSWGEAHEGFTAVTFGSDKVTMVAAQNRAPDVSAVCGSNILPARRALRSGGVAPSVAVLENMAAGASMQTGVRVARQERLKNESLVLNALGDALPRSLPRQMSSQSLRAFGAGICEASVFEDTGWTMLAAFDQDVVPWCAAHIIDKRRWGYKPLVNGPKLHERSELNGEWSGFRPVRAFFIEVLGLHVPSRKFVLTAPDGSCAYQVRDALQGGNCLDMDNELVRSSLKAISIPHIYRLAFPPPHTAPPPPPPPPRHFKTHAARSGSGARREQRELWFLGAHPNFGWGQVFD